jgi:amino acid transporter
MVTADALFQEHTAHQMSEPAAALRRELSPLGVFILTLSCLSPVFCIYAVGADVLQHAGTAAAALFLFGLFSAAVWAVVYAELGSAYPFAGGDYVGVGSILGPWAGFASLVVWAVTAGPGIALGAKAIAVYVDDLTSLGAPNAVAVCVLIVAIAVALLAVRTSALVTGVFLCIELLAVVVLIWAGIRHQVRGISEVLLHPVALDSAGRLGSLSITTLAVGAVTATSATAGGNQAIAFGEELRQPQRNMGRVILLAGLGGAIATALPVIVVTLWADDLVTIFKSSAPFSAFVYSVLGPAAARALSAGVALAIFNSLIVLIMFYSRLFFSIGRDGILHPRLNRLLARVHGQSGAPRGATLAVGIFGGACCPLNLHSLIIFLQGLSVYILALVSIAVLVGRRRRMTGQVGYWRSPLFPLAPALGIFLAIGFCVADLLDAEGGRPSVLVLGAVVVTAILWHHFVLRRRPGGWSPRLG